MKNKKFIIALWMCLLILGFLVYMQHILSANRPSLDEVAIEEHWTITKEGIVYEDVNLIEYVRGTYHCGEEIELKNMLPSDTISNPLLVIYSTHSSFSVKVGEEVIYENDIDLAENAMVGYGYHYIDLPKHYQGKEILIQVTIGVNSTFKCIEEVKVCDGAMVIREQCIDKGLTLLINSFLIIFGCGVLLVSIVFIYKFPGFFKLACIGGFSLGIAIWSMCNYNLITVFTYNPHAKAILEFATLYWSPIPFFLYFWDDIQQEKRKMFRPVYYLILNCQVAFTVTIYILQALRICRMAEYLFVAHILLVAMILFVIVMNVYDLWHKNYEHIPLIIGMVVLLATGLYDVLWFNIQKYIVFFKNETYFSALCVGAFIFVIGQIFDFCAEIGKGLYERARTATLERLVYADALTNIANRRKCEEDMDHLDASEQVYGIISFDLNDLKKVNDSIGHEMGDEMIKQFAQILEYAFADVATVGRMGGDEFIAIFPDVEKVDVDDYLKIMNYYISKKNEEFDDFQIHVAYGYCQSNESADMKAKDVYKTADARMYKMKYKMKGAYR